MFRTLLATDPKELSLGSGGDTMRRLFALVLALSLCLATVATAAEDTKKGVHFAGIGAHFQANVGEDLWNTASGLGLQVDLGNLTPRMRLYGILSHVTAWERPLFEGPKVEANQLGISGFVRYYLNPTVPWKFYFGGGAGIYHSSVTPNSFHSIPPEYNGDHMTLGVDLGVGVQKYFGEQVSMYGEFGHKLALGSAGFDMTRVVLGVTWHPEGS